MNQFNISVAPWEEGQIPSMGSSGHYLSSQDEMNPDSKQSIAQTIVVGLDTTPLASKVFEAALLVAKEKPSILKLVHCPDVKVWDNLTPMIDSGMGLRSRSSIETQQELSFQEEVQSIQVWLKDLCQTAHSYGVQADYAISQIGGPGPVICELAKSLQATYIIVGSHGKQGLKELLLGSVSKYVTNHATCPVIVVQSGNSPNLQFPPAT